MLTTDLTRPYPELHHMAADGSWPSIQRHGLLSTAALVEKWQVVEPGIRSSLLEQRREESRVLKHPMHAAAVIRDQKPIHEPSLGEALDGMTVGQWYEVLSARVFFFLQRERLEGLLNARSYTKDSHTVITIDTANFVAAHEREIELCTINSGFAQRHSKARRGLDTFQSISDYRHRALEAQRTCAPWDVAEFCVPGGVRDIGDHIIRVEWMRGDEILERIV